MNERKCKAARWAVSAGLAAVLVIVIRYTVSITWMTNDDVSILNVLSGAGGAPASFSHPYSVNIVLTAVISCLYRLVPLLNWWLIFTLAAVAAGMTFVHYGILTAFGCRRMSMAPAVLSIAVLDLGFFFYNIEYLSFTVAPAVLGAGALALLIGYAQGRITGGRVFWLGEALLFLIVSAHRAETGWVVLAFILLVLLYTLMRRRGEKKVIKAAAVFAVYAVVLTVAVPAVNSFVTVSVDGSGFAKFDSARIAYVDYAHESYLENPELYESIGWDYNLSVLADNWYFMDERVTAENLEYLADSGGGSGLETIADTLTGAFGSRTIRYSYLSWLFISVTTLIYMALRQGLKYRLEIAVLAFGLAGTHILLLYLAFIGRMPYRTAAAVLIPAAVLSIMMLGGAAGEEKSSIVFCASCVIFIPALCLALSGPFAEAVDKEVIAERDSGMAVYGAVLEYTESHAENLYIRIPGEFTNLNAAFKMRYQSGNLLSWGGSQWGSAANLALWEKNGVTEPDSLVFKADNAYLLSEGDIRIGIDGCELLAVFYNYLGDRYDVDGFTVEEVIPGVYAYRFLFDGEYQGDYYYLTEEGYCVSYEG